MIDFSVFAFYWAALGVASSIGLGTGLHTFILYLAPHIIKVVVVANECNEVPAWEPSRWRFDHFAPCEAVPESEVTIGFMPIFRAIILEAMIWGMGTALGELPPYFVARAASEAGGMDDELNEILNGESPDQITYNESDSWLDRGKKRIAGFLRNHAFITVLLMASVSGSLCGPCVCCADPEPVVRPRGPDVRAPADPLHDLLRAHAHRKRRQQGLHTGRLPRRGLLEAHAHALTGAHRNGGAILVQVNK